MGRGKRNRTVKNLFPKKAPTYPLPIDKTVLAESSKTDTQLLDCGEGTEGRYEVISQGVLIACTDDYTVASNHYFKASAAVASERAAVFNERLNEARKAGLISYLAHDVATGSLTLESALEEARKPKGIPVDELPVNVQLAARLNDHDDL